MQIALYLFDVYDDGTADIRSLLIGLLFFALGLVFALWRVPRRTENDGPISVFINDVGRSKFNRGQPE